MKRVDGRRCGAGGLSYEQNAAKGEAANSNRRFGLGIVRPLLSLHSDAPSRK
jgi:hypothetical protein